MGDACPPAIIVSGDPTEVATLADALRAAGLEAPEEACPAERVHVERNDAGLVLTIADIDGRLATRTVHDIATASAVIASFARSSERRRPPVSIELDREDPILAVPIARGHTHPHPAYTLGVGAETSLTPDGAVWFGVRAAGCVHFERSCLGGAVRIAYDAGFVRHETYRTGADLLVTLARPYVNHRLTVTPAVGVGVGWLRVRGDDADGDDPVSVDTGGVRAETRLTVETPLTDVINLRLGLAATVSPIAHTDRFTSGMRTAPGEPWAFGRLELGVEFP